MSLFPIVLALHVALALGLLLPSVFLPFALRAGRAPAESGGRLVRSLIALQADGSGLIGVGLAATGATLVGLIGPQLLAQPWLLAAVAIYGVNVVLAFFVQRPELARLAGIRAGRDDLTWRARARRQRYVSYALAGLTGTIGYLMTTKPALW